MNKIELLEQKLKANVAISARQDVPVGISVLGNGKFKIDYSLSRIVKWYDTLEEAIDEILK